MAATVSLLPQQSPAHPSRARILAAGRRQLSQNPDASLTDIADAAGIARRTLYQYFPRREALVDALATEAGQALTDALAAARRPRAEPPEALARLILAACTVGEHYRMLISLARRRLGEERIRAILAPARAEAAAILERGQQDGSFAAHLPAPLLALVNESVVLVILETGFADGSDAAREAAATTVLLTAGVTARVSRRAVQAVLREAPAPSAVREPAVPDPAASG
jgi:AcrR family transcriptional regulator